MFDKQFNTIECGMDEEVIFDMFLSWGYDIHLVDRFVVVDHQKHRFVML